ncbi:unnamed protein product [Cyclocybe aegerita]|uniref:HNH nuclease domain-containing protein n=1 Tax=Cyclocybe aegerita TaxID=1973307 RepID=A0A8S0Y061_CYCAE|nr:unnamed protein product [Cyclocybe aegerita]
MAHNRTDSKESNSSPSTLDSPSTTASELQIFTDLSADVDRSTLSDADVIAQTKKAKDIIKKLEENDTANIFKPSATATSLRLHRVLQAMLTCAEDIKMPPQSSAASRSDGKADFPQHRGLVYVIKAILTCSERAEEGDRGGPLRREELVKNLRALAVTWVTHFLFPFKASPRTYAQQASEIFSDIATPTYERTADDMPTRSIGRRTLDTDTVLRRDGYTCVITGIVDNRRPVDPGVAKLEVAHVLRRAVGGQSHRETDPSFRLAAATFDILRNYTRLPDDYLRNLEDHIDHPSNAITLEPNTHTLFDQYQICLLPTATEHTYALDWFDKSRVADFLSGLCKLGGRNLADPVVFRNHAPAYHMPDPIFIRIHATVAGVLDMSGAAEFIDDLIDKHPPSGSSKPASSWSDMEDLISLHEVVTELQRAKNTFKPSLHRTPKKNNIPATSFLSSRYSSVPFIRDDIPSASVLYPKASAFLLLHRYCPSLVLRFQLCMPTPRAPERQHDPSSSQPTRRHERSSFRFQAHGIA